jgi:hypothetical protein
MAVNQLPSIPYRMHAPTPKATMKEMLKFIGMLGAPVVAPVVMLRAGEDHMMDFPQNLRRGIASIQRSNFWPRCSSRIVEAGPRWARQA